MNAFMLLPALCQALAQEVPIVLALPKEAPLLLEVKLAEVQAWTFFFGSIPCSPQPVPCGAGIQPAPPAGLVQASLPLLHTSVSLFQHM